MTLQKNFLEILKKPLVTLSDKTEITILQILLVFAFLIIAWFVTRFIARFIGKRILSRFEMTQDNVIVIQRVIFILLMFIFGLTALSILHVPFTAFAFLSGALAIGVGFGAKNLIDNSISGWILMSERPIRIGDFIEMDDNNRGIVQRVGFRSTMIRRTDGAHMVIPNSDLLQTRLVNWTLFDPNIRTSFKVGVAYGSDTRLVNKILQEVLEQHSLIIADPKPLVVFEDFADSALVFEVWFWAAIRGEKELRTIRSDLRFMIDKRFRENGIVIAFPQRDVHLFSEQPIKFEMSGASAIDNQTLPTQKSSGQKSEDEQ